MSVKTPGSNLHMSWIRHRNRGLLPENREMQQRLKWQVSITLYHFFWVVDKKLCLLTCAVYLVTSLSMEKFLEAFRRFIACRGRFVVYNDNGKNFVGAKNLLQNINWRKISQYCVLNEITCHFNLPLAAWWREWWERLIRLLKDLLTRTLKRTSLSWTKKLTLFYTTAKLLWIQDLLLNREKYWDHSFLSNDVH